MSKPQERDPGSAYTDDIVESIDWWTIVAFRLFPRFSRLWSKSAIPNADVLRRTDHVLVP